MLHAALLNRTETFPVTSAQDPGLSAQVTSNVNALHTQPHLQGLRDLWYNKGLDSEEKENNGKLHHRPSLLAANNCNTHLM